MYSAKMRNPIIRYTFPGFKCGNESYISLFNIIPIHVHYDKKFNTNQNKFIADCFSFKINKSYN